MIARTLTSKIIALAQKFQVITLTGPRQSGKTTLVKAAFPTLPYVSLEEPDIRQIALTDPRSFLSTYSPPTPLVQSWMKSKTPLTYFPTSRNWWTKTGNFNLS